MNTLVVDIETHAFKNEVKRMRVCQLAWQRFSPRAECVSECNFYIRPDGWSMTAKAQGYHKITNETLQAKGQPLRSVLKLFTEDLLSSQVWVGHGMDLVDLPVLTEELQECGFDEAVAHMHGGMHMFDTMAWCTDLMQLPRRDGVAGFKHPRLSELYEWLCYPNKMTNAHDASADVDATAQCYWRLCQLADQVNSSSRPSAPVPTSKDERPLEP